MPAGLKKVYLTSSQDLLLRDEAMEKIRQLARKHGYDELRRFILNEETPKEAILNALGGASLFAAKTLTEVKIYTDELKADQEKTLSELINVVNAVGEDTMLSVGLPRLSAAARKKKWLTELQRKDGNLQILYPPQEQDYLDWLQERAAKVGLQLEKEALRFLAVSCEGDLSTAAGELEKLALGFPKQEGTRRLTYDDVCRFVSDHSEYAIFALSNSALAGKPARCRRILRRLRAENIHPTQINWILARDLRMLMRLGNKSSGSITPGEWAAHGIFGPGKRNAQAALRRFAGKTALLGALIRLCAMADRSAKGGGSEHVWPILEAIALQIAGSKTPGRLPITLRE